jgi:hypothetical protein
MIKYNIEISLIIDLQSQEQSIYNFFSEKGCKIQNFYFVEDQYRDSLDLDIQTLTFLNTFIKQHTIDGIIISTEPKAHYAYLDRAVTT